MLLTWQNIGKALYEMKPANIVESHHSPVKFIVKILRNIIFGRTKVRKVLACLHWSSSHDHTVQRTKVLDSLKNAEC